MSHSTCTHISTYAHTHKHIYTRIQVHTYTHSHVHNHTHTHIHAYTHTMAAHMAIKSDTIPKNRMCNGTHTHIHIYTHVHILWQSTWRSRATVHQKTECVTAYIHKHTTHVHTYTRTRIHTYTRTHMHTYYGLATISRLLIIISLFCKRAL